jgi:hypothetical protein
MKKHLPQRFPNHPRTRPLTTKERKQRRYEQSFGYGAYGDGLSWAFWFHARRNPGDPIEHMMFSAVWLNGEGSILPWHRETLLADADASTLDFLQDTIEELKEVYTIAYMRTYPGALQPTVVH